MLKQQEDDSATANKSLEDALQGEVNARQPGARARDSRPAAQPRSKKKPRARRGSLVPTRERRYFFAGAAWPAVAMKLSNVFSVTRNQRICSFWNAV